MKILIDFQDLLKRDVVVVSLLLIGDMFQISKVTTRDGSLTIGDPVSFHLAVDGLLKFVLASWIFGFPDMFLHIIVCLFFFIGLQYFFNHFDEGSHLHLKY